jgi:uncharacterized protein (DUF1499 family)
LSLAQDCASLGALQLNSEASLRVHYRQDSNTPAGSPATNRGNRLRALGLAAVLALIATPGMTTDMLTDFDSLRVPQSPNTWLVAPAEVLEDQADSRAEVLNVSAQRLATAWQEVLAAADRTRVTATSPDGLQVEAEQRSALFGFVDDISFRALPRGDDRATFIAYSRSRVGYWDLGVNQRRLSAWLQDLRQRIGDGS